MSSITQKQIERICELKSQGMKHRDISEEVFGVRTSASSVHSVLRRFYYPKNGGAKVKKEAAKHTSGAKILVLDVETAPILAAVWGLFKQNIGLNMIARDWFLLSWSAKWVGSDEVLYDDIREQFDGSAESLLNVADDEQLLQGMWDLMNEADIIITQNGKRFDAKKLNARFLMNGMPPVSSYRHIDTLEIAKKHFGFTSNKLEYMTDKLCKKYKKLNHGKFSGYSLWRECQLGNNEAWEEMEEYNKYDVLSLEELAYILAPYSNRLPNLDMYHDSIENKCFCGSDEWIPNGFSYTNLSKFTKFKCKSCGAERRDRVNLLSKEKRQSLRMNAA
jgi:hypothetical protein